jgi:hypothetical protein
MRPFGLFLLMAAQAFQFQITDARGKQTSAATIETGTPDRDGWCELKVAKAAKTRGEPVLVWPFDASAKLPDGPEPVPAIVIQRGDERALANKRVMAAIAIPVVLGVATLEEIAGKTGLAAEPLKTALSGLASSTDVFEKGVGLLYAGKSVDAADALAIALRQRQRQLTRVPSEIYSAAILYGQALLRAGKFDDSAVAFLTALKQRPGDEGARKLRAEALIKAGKPEAVER